MAASDATKEALWLIKLLNEMTTLKEKPTVHIDNESIIKLIKNPEFHCRTKHSDVRYCFMIEKYQEGEINMVYMPTESQAADILTKIPALRQLKAVRELLGLCDASVKERSF